MGRGRLWTGLGLVIGHRGLVFTVPEVVYRVRVGLEQRVSGERTVYIVAYLEQRVSGERTVRIFRPSLAALYIHSSTVAKQPHTSYDKQW